MLDAYQDRLDYLYGRLNYETAGMPGLPSELRIGRMRRLLRVLGDPHSGLRIVHVAGTKGKGSTAAMLASALSAGGRRTALYCSPHLHRLEERYQIDGRPITAAELCGLVDEVRAAVERLEAEDPLLRSAGATFFEITTAMGLLHFARAGTDVVVLEVGMGGRLDSTNVVRPVLSVITSIAFDHTRQLGNTLGAIATEKAGILKRSRPAVSGVLPDEPREAIRRVAAARRCPLRELGVDFTFHADPPRGPLVRPTPGSVSVRTWRTDWGAMDLPLLGLHQAHNAAVAMAALDVLAEREPGLSIGPADVSRGFASLRWPARVEVLGEAPWLVVDGAHNVASAEALARTLAENFPDVPRALVFGTTRDKDLRGQLRALLPLFPSVVATRYRENPRAVPPEDVAEAVFELSGRAAEVVDDPPEAIERARGRAGVGGLVCITGSLFLAAEARAAILGLEGIQPRAPSPR
ncbi:Folylpolyglutamate synthase [Aquisphaera giovannonii]|uniref:Dihydrofolate synthase/folylpolyglutamate synthase n=1 Tax=Aquisphaera giovannonii TaxID=406548 RepID=A0A5B9WBY9_9BACT|nr:folylpolyglutamate synthase/dihydrofolate synthase family protein [Aquisphaera giovannonii]QEH37784.1 Folylpolyglutamate synthase [Aquisphaera giovannonii]